IIQDMGLLELDLPPIPLHASTQCDNRSVEKVQFLEQCGFEQVVLARELSLQQIREIGEKTSVALECFVHGALCVSYSGQCYLSYALRERSANRGACAQMCRLPYTLLDADEEVLSRNQHLLSLKDFDASAHLLELMQAGVSSFKIEGRLKEANYVKNITAYYRQKIDKLIEGTDYRRASSGVTRFSFEPNPQKTFYRGATDYFLRTRTATITSFETPKSLGEPVGTVREVWRNAFSVNSDKEFANGDGLCCVNTHGDFVGFRVNKVENGRLFPLEMPDIKPNALLYRNADAAFDKLLAGKTAERKIPVTVSISDTTDGLTFVMMDTYGNQAQLQVVVQKETANNAGRAVETFKTQLSKLGNTDFETTEVLLNFEQPWFIPVSQLAEWRRQLVVEFEQVRAQNYPKREFVLHKTTHPYMQSTVDYRANAFNAKAIAFYSRHKTEVMQPAFEEISVPDAELMRTKHCIKYSFGWCPKQRPEKTPKEPLTLQYGETKLKLSFDCARCEMVITQKK
ncbi:MAG TPA: U32 family peptidase, partial [Paludibacteraceae bacterium]|nr:U32 family peptidase [Paludibacteraceae bacterium]